MLIENLLFVLRLALLCCSAIVSSSATNSPDTATITMQSEHKSAASSVSDFCLNESFNASCDPGHVILMTSAQFGRMRPGRCISGDFNIGCVKDVKRLLDGACALRTSCDISVRSFVDLHPCQRDFVSYLEASYECIKVSGLNSDVECPLESGEVQLTGLRSGYLARQRWYPAAGFIPRHAVIGTSTCPWSLTVDNGQTINVSIINLPVPINVAHLDSFTDLMLTDEISQFISTEKAPCSSPSAFTVDVIVDDLIAKRRTHLRDVMCSKPERHLFTSVGNTIRIHVTGDITENGGRAILLHFAAVGCPEPVAPPGASARRLLDATGSAVIRCNDTMETWYLTCQSNRWIGEIGNCSSKSVEPLKVTDAHSGVQYHFDGVIIAILIGVGLGVAIGLFLLLVLHIARRRGRRQQDENVSGLALLTTGSSQKWQFRGNTPRATTAPPSECADSEFTENACGLFQTRLHVLPCDCGLNRDFSGRRDFHLVDYNELNTKLPRQLGVAGISKPLLELSSDAPSSAVEVMPFLKQRQPVCRHHQSFNVADSDLKSCECGRLGRTDGCSNINRFSDVCGQSAVD